MQWPEMLWAWEAFWKIERSPGGFRKTTCVVCSSILLSWGTKGSLYLEGQKTQLCCLKEHLCILKVKMPLSSSFL